MKSYTVRDIDKRYSESKIKPVAQLIDIKTPVSNVMGFTKCLYIVIPGEPIADSRPRFTSNGGHFYNSHKANLMKVFNKIYQESGLLQSLTIFGPMKIVLRAYTTFPKTHYKKLNKKEKNDLEKENIPGIFRPDNDNYEKVHIDVLQDDAFMIIFDDEAMCENHTIKLFVKSKEYARMELYIYFNFEVKPWIREILLESKDYLKYKLSPKWMKLNITKDIDKNWRKLFFQHIEEYIAKYPKKSNSLVKTVNKILRQYTTEELRYLTDGRSRDEVINNILNKVERMCK